MKLELRELAALPTGLKEWELDSKASGKLGNKVSGGLIRCVSAHRTAKYL